MAAAVPGKAALGKAVPVEAASGEAAATSKVGDTAATDEDAAEGGEAGAVDGVGAQPGVPVLPFVPPPALPVPAPAVSMSGSTPAAGGDHSESQIAGAKPAGGVQATAGRAAGIRGADGETTGASEPGGDIAKGSDFLAALAEAVPTAPAAPEAAKAVPTAPGTVPAIAEKAAAPAAAPPVPLGQVPMTIGLRSLAGSSEFRIRLDPLELGRIDVTLDIDKDRGTVTTHLVVERVETLQMLQRDAGSLQQALTQAGLDPSEGGINLSLRSDGGAGGGTAEGDGRPARGTAPKTSSEPAVMEVAPMRALRGLAGLDIRI